MTRTDAKVRQAVLLPALVLLGVVSTAVGSLGAPLLPTIVTDLHVSLATSQWALTISLVAGAVAAPLLGRLGDGRRRRETILCALAVVASGCVLSALPLGFEWLLVGRALQGVGLGLVPLAITAARDGLPKRKQASGIALIGVTTAAGLGIGYPVAGLITAYGGLSAAFWFGAALTVVTIAVAAWALPPNPDRQPRRLDAVGLALLGVAIVALLLACSQGPQWGWTSPALASAVVVTVIATCAWIWWELRHSTPLVDVRLLRHPSVLAADVMVVLVGAGIYPLLSLVVRYTRTPTNVGYGYGYSAALAGVMLVPYSVGSFLASRLAVRAMRRFSLEALTAASSAVLIASMVLFLTTRAHLVLLLMSMGLAGFGIGVVFAVNPAQIHRGVPPHETGSANSFYQVLRYVGYSVGSALSATLLATHTPDSADIPTENGYAAAAWTGIIALAVAVAAALLLNLNTKKRKGVDAEHGTSRPTPDGELLTPALAPLR
ncbi:MFS transporter [Nocardia sp. NBC_00565]|uniref:MFS transporter n=1 Tax=Nocardia sp. NBC_00565 TaxID=2975993 RepID=UPI002E802150|nr:MFS transporter [Nocardia sp. NBC_00565]WUC05709.1 MFS transporter [Nocardia sp. NBC_00565]